MVRTREGWAGVVEEEMVRTREGWAGVKETDLNASSCAHSGMTGTGFPDAPASVVGPL